MAIGKRDIVYMSEVVVTQMKASLPAKLTALNAEYADGIVLENVEPGNYFISEKEKVPAYPVMCVIGNSTEMPVDGQYRYGIEYHDITIAIALVFRGASEEELKRRTSRMARAVEEVCLDNQTLSGSCADVVVTDKQFSQLLTQNGAHLQEGQINVRVMTTDHE